jgi:hypothetical protein
MASLGNVSASTPGAPENRVWQKSFETLATRLGEPLQTAGRHQENGGAGYDYAVDSLLAAETAAPAYTSATRAFWVGPEGEAAANASGASVLQLSPEAQAAFDAQIYGPMQAESAAWAQGAVGENAAVFIGNGAGRTFWGTEFPQLMNNVNNGTLNTITFHF